jgi:aspartate-semialdehyde dehydrogenase
VLEERGFPVEKLFALASDRSFGRNLTFRDKSLGVRELKGFEFSQVDIALFSAGAETSRQFAPRAVVAGCWVIDNTSEFRLRDDVPLVVPEVNREALEALKSPGIIANPNCSTIQLVVALKPLHDAAGILRIDVATYQSASGAGRAAVEELARQSIQVLGGKGPIELDDGYKQTAFNCIPHIDEFQ